MTPRERSLWLRFQRRASSLSPELSKELLAAYKAIRESLSDAEIARLIAEGRIDAILDDALLDRSVIPLRQKIQEAVERGFKATVTDLPKGGKIDGQVAVAFDTLNPRVIDAVRELDSRVVNTLKEDVRETVRAFVEDGLRNGDSPKSVARRIRSVVGLSPSQAENARKYEARLQESGRYSAAQVEKLAATYRRQAVALNANTNARTATTDALKLGQKLSWDDAISKGIVDPSNLYKRWVSVQDDRVRDEHVAMHGEEVPFGNVYSNGEDVPGESSFNCRCVSLFVVRRAA
jgi:hypothetical protein